VGWPEVKSRTYTPPATLRCSLEVHEYLTPSRVERPWGVEIVHTPGWFVLATTDDGGTVYQRVFDGAGPEQFGTSDWAELTEEI
jgi:hypothetical protein